jgi:cytochrome c oxidase assembly factor CtaG
MLVAGLALAAPVVRPRRVMPLLGPLLLLGAAIQGGLLGVLLTFANRPWYAVGVGGQLSPLADQQAGGALMWVFGGIVYVISAAVGLARWLQRDARTSERMDARRWKDMGYAR